MAIAFIAFVTTSVLLTLAPGPDIFFVIAQSISHGKWAGISTALGLCTGLIAHTLAAAFGVSVILYNSAIGFQVIKWAGALYLFYLTIISIREGRKNQKQQKITAPKLDVLSLYKKGIFMNILNPKVSLFFLAFLPQFVTGGNVGIQMGILGLIFIAQALVVFTLVSIFAGYLSSTLRSNSRFAKVIYWLKASIFGSIGVKLAMASK